MEGELPAVCGMDPGGANKFFAAGPRGLGSGG